MNRTDYNRFEISYLTDNIKFADSKAGVLIGMDGLLLRAGIDYFNSAGITPQTLFTSSASVGRLSVIFGSFFLIIGIILALAVVFPRRASGLRQGFVKASFSSLKSLKNPHLFLVSLGSPDRARALSAADYFVMNAVITINTAPKELTQKARLNIRYFRVAYIET